MFIRILNDYFTEILQSSFLFHRSYEKSLRNDNKQYLSAYSNPSLACIEKWILAVHSVIGEMEKKRVHEFNRF